MLKRIITSLVALCVLIPVLIFSGSAVLPIMIALATVICVYEMLKCMGISRRVLVAGPQYIAAVALPFLMRYVEDLYVVAKLCFVFAVCALALVFVSIIWSHGKLPFADAISSYAIAIYIIGAMNSIIYVRDFGDAGKYIYLLIFIGAWVTDIFAYFVGVFFGKHKLIEDVSPKKTIEGSIGGIVFCALFFVLFGIVVDEFFDRHANIIFLAIAGVAVSLISQIGDLIMSVIKRHYGIKDYGKLFPGHGGMLDRFDSVLAVSVGMSAICIISSVFGLQLL